MPSLLYVTQCAAYAGGPAGVHGVLDQSARAIAQLAALHGLTFTEVSDVRSLPVDELADAAVVALFTIGEVPWSDEQRAELLAGVRSGRSGVLALHSATDSCYEWPDYGQLVGARFDGHPWTTDIELVVDRDHPATRHLHTSWTLRDEVYLFRELRPDARVLLRANPESLDMSVPGARVPDIGVPLAWCHNEGAGRVFSTTPGHFPHAWELPAYVQHVSGGLAWVLGEAE
jgi:type 1 glutamine amidotransferase